MPLQPCRECRHHVSTEAQACPRCGALHPAGAPGGALVLREAGAAPVPAAPGAGPSPEFWRAARLVFRRVRFGLYGAGSGLFAAMLTGSLVLPQGRAAMPLGLLTSLVLCLMAIVLDLLDLHLGKGGANDD